MHSLTTVRQSFLESLSVVSELAGAEGYRPSRRLSFTFLPSTFPRQLL